MIRGKILSGDLSTKTKIGYMVIGPNSLNFSLETWHMSSEEEALKFANHIGGETGGCYEVLKYEMIGVVRPVRLQTEYIPLKIDTK